MKITFLGTSHGVPSKNRFCSSALIEVNSSVYIIDAGAPLADALARSDVDISHVKAFFATHSHCDHVVGIIQLSSLLNWHYKEHGMDFFLTDKALADGVQSLIETMDGSELDKSRIRYSVVREGVAFEDENIRVRYIKTAHTKDSYAILVCEKGEKEKHFLFSGDLSGGLCRDDVPRAIQEELELFVCELAHFDISCLTPYLESCRAKRVVFTHVYPYEKFDDIRSLDGKYPFSVIIAEDGMRIEI